MDQSTLYTADGLKALKLRLATSDPATSHDFSPEYVYPLFGEQEVVYGYRDLSIKLWFASGSLRNYLGISYEGQPAPGGKALDVEKTFYELIPADYTKSLEEFEETVKKDEASFVPYGTKIGEYARKKKTGDVLSAALKGKGKARADADPDATAAASSKGLWENCDVDDPDAVVFEAYHATFETTGKNSKNPDFKAYHRRMQLFVLLYIEGGSYIDEEDDRWEFVCLYEKRKGTKKGSYTYHFVGYTSLYQFFHWPDKTRLRLAQFIILPPYQGAGHGSAFYSLVYLYYLSSRPDIAELVIEDPSEAFQDMRDKVDYRTLASAGAFKGISAPVDPQWREDTRKEWKLGARQFYRLVEMALRKDLLDTQEKLSEKKRREKERNYRLMVKERLCRFNYEILAPMSQNEKRETLQQTYDSVVDEYDRLLDQIGQ